MLRRLLGCLLIGFLAVSVTDDGLLAQVKAPAKVKGKAKSPYPGYTEHKVEGFVLYLHDDILEEEAKSERDVSPIEALDIEFKTITKVMPEKYVKELRKLPIFARWKEVKEKDVSGGGQGFTIAYYTTLEQQFQTRNTVVILRTDFITSRHQPEIPDPFCVLLHEFAHAVDHAIYDYKFPPLVKAYEAAMDRGLYGPRPAKGEMGKIYAATNSHEYFAELTTSYLDKGRKPILTRDELKTHDIEGYKAMEQVWGKNPERFVIKTKAKGPAKAATPAVVAKKDPPRTEEKKADEPADKEKQAGDKLKAIEFILKAGRKDSAKEKIDELIKQFPETEAARKAEDLKKAIK